MTSGAAGLVVAGVLVDDTGRVLAARRSYPDDLAGKWEFPGGKAEADESPRDGLVRELSEELDIVATVGAELPGPVAGHWPISASLRMRAFWCTTADQPSSTGADHDLIRWVTPDELVHLDLLPADVALATSIAGHLAKAR